MKNYNWSEQAIAEAAYYIWMNNGCPMNTNTQDWYAAINQLNSLANAKKTALASDNFSAKKGLLSSLTAKKTSACKTLTSKKTSACKTTTASKKSSACKATTASKNSSAKKATKKSK